MLAVAQRELVERKRWLTREEFLDLLSVAQVLPGPNIVNLSMMLGDRWVGSSFSAVANTRPAATTPMPRSAPLTAGMLS